MALPPFQQLLDQYGADVHRLLVASVGRSDADDCYQETWIAALRSYPRLQDAGNLKGWVLTIAHRKAIDQIRRRARIAVPAGGSTELAEATAASNDPARASDDAADSPWSVVRELPPKQRLAVALRFALDLDYEAVGAAMGTSSDAARRNVHEGIKKLRKELSDD